MKVWQISAMTIALVAVTAAARPTRESATPETVIITLRSVVGADSALLDVLDRHWTEVTQRNAVVPSPHLTLRGADADGRAYFVEILTWRDPAFADSAPAPVRALWDRMMALTAARGSRPGLEIMELAAVRRSPPKQER